MQCNFSIKNNLRSLAKKTLSQQENHSREIYNIMNNNYGKGNIVDAVLKLLLSSKNLGSLDNSLVSLFSEISEFDVLVDQIEHEEANPEMYIKETKSKKNNKEMIVKLKSASQKLKSIQKLIKKSKHEMEKEKVNLVKVHEIYTDKFGRRVKGSTNNLDEKSKRILMESLMNSQNKSIMNLQKKTIAREKEEDILEEKANPLDKTFKSVSEKTEEVKKIFDKVTPEQKKAIINSLETRKKILEL
jgi:hypothetical protein